MVLQLAHEIMTTAHCLFYEGWSKTRIKQCLLALLAPFLVALISTSQAANGSVTPKEWERLFFGEQVPERINGAVFALNLASKPPNAIIRIGQDPISYVVTGDVVESGPNVFTIKKITDKSVFLLGQNGVLFELAVQTPTLVNSKSVDTAQNAGSLFSGNRRRQPALTMTARNTMFSLSKVPESKVTTLARAAGVPGQFAHLLAANIEPARSRGGRPGWKVTAVPTLLQRFGVNVMTGDIILAVDSIPAQQLDLLQQHLVDRVDGQVFQVELQRDGKLVMVEFKE